MRSAAPSLVLGISGALTLLAGCTASNGSVPVGSMPALTQQSDGRRGSWMARGAKSQDLLYVSDLNKDAVFIYAYPGGKLEGTLKGFSAPHGECVDQRNNVFIVNQRTSTIIEYAHAGTKPLRTLNDPGYYPSNCAVDPVTGDLTVTNITPLGTGEGNAVLYRHAKGKPTTYPASNIYYYYFPAYDAKGNLFVDGSADEEHHVDFQFAEFPAGGKAWKPILLEHDFAHPGAVQWVGKKLVVGDQVDISSPSTTYEFSLKRRVGKPIGATPLVDSCDVLQALVDGDRLIAADDCGATVRYFAFPSGGMSTKTISKRLSQPVGLAISRAH